MAIAAALTSGLTQAPDPSSHSGFPSWEGRQVMPLHVPCSLQHLCTHSAAMKGLGADSGRPAQSSTALARLGPRCPQPWSKPIPVPSPSTAHMAPVLPEALSQRSPEKCTLTWGKDRGTLESIAGTRRGEDPTPAALTEAEGGAEGSQRHWLCYQGLPSVGQPIFPLHFSGGFVTHTVMCTHTYSFSKAQLRQWWYPIQLHPGFNINPQVKPNQSPQQGEKKWRKPPVKALRTSEMQHRA